MSKCQEWNVKCHEKPRRLARFKIILYVFNINTKLRNVLVYVNFPERDWKGPGLARNPTGEYLSHQKPLNTLIVILFIQFDEWRSRAEPSDHERKKCSEEDLTKWWLHQERIKNSWRFILDKTRRIIFHPFFKDGESYTRFKPGPRGYSESQLMKRRLSRFVRTFFLPIVVLALGGFQFLALEISFFKSTHSHIISIKTACGNSSCAISTTPSMTTTRNIWLIKPSSDQCHSTARFWLLNFLSTLLTW